MPTPTVFLLDLGGVLFQPAAGRASQIDWEHVTRLNARYGRALNLGEDLFPAFLADYNRLSGLDWSGEQFFDQIFETVAMQQDLLTLLSPLGEIIVVSDNYRENIAYIFRRFGLGKWVSDQHCSYDYQVFKSDPRFFERLLSDRPDLKERRPILIDDNPRNIDSARTLGIEGVAYQHTAGLRAELVHMGLDI